MKVVIVGAGIGGLTTALALHEIGVEAEVYERARELRELGVGINMLPHAIKELAAFGLLPALDGAGIRTRELIYANRFGQTGDLYMRQSIAEIWQSMGRGEDIGLEPRARARRACVQAAEGSVEAVDLCCRAAGDARMSAAPHSALHRSRRRSDIYVDLCEREGEFDGADAAETGDPAPAAGRLGAEQSAPAGAAVSQCGRGLRRGSGGEVRGDVRSQRLARGLAQRGLRLSPLSHWCP
jgi:hypothetical protein